MKPNVNSNLFLYVHDRSDRIPTVFVLDKNRDYFARQLAEKMQAATCDEANTALQ